jgi:hypothetical protein
MQWLQDPNQIKVDNPKNASSETSRHFRKEKYVNLKFNKKIMSVIKIAEIFIKAPEILKQFTKLALI